MLTVAALTQIMPGAARNGRVERFLAPLVAAMAEFGIDTPLRQAAFLAQLAVESGELQYTREIWGPTAQQLKYEPPGDLADVLGNVHPGDGKRFRGRGLIQLTGRRNYTDAARGLQVDLVAHPELLEQPELAVRSAAWFWFSRGLGAVADRDDIRAVTKLVNGGLTHLSRRQDYYARAKAALGAED